MKNWLSKLIGPTAGGRASGERLCQACRVREGTIVIETVGSIPDNNMVVCTECAEEYKKFIGDGTPRKSTAKR